MRVRNEIRISGFGGQGVVTAGRIISLTVLSANPNLHVVYSPSYGFATRGGNATSDVIIDDERIWYPKILNADVLMALSQAAFNASAKLVKEKGIIIFDPLLVTDTSRNNGNTKMIPIRLSEIAKDLGSNIYVSMAAAGALAYYYPKLITIDALLDVANNYFRKELATRNSQAIKRGYELARQNKIQAGIMIDGASGFHVHP
jgi:2-oxoglutarate ferredoxin oxidoreductase subunit gamma